MVFNEALFNLEGIRCKADTWGPKRIGRFDWERRSDEASEFSCLHENERCEVRDDDGPIAQLARAHD